MSSTTAAVHTGFWVNWSYGRVHGSTITLSPQSSAYLVAFIALFVRLAGGQLWGVLAFLASVTRSTSDPQDALYHQQQAILRNSSSPAVVTWSMLKLSWFWKGTAKRVRTRIFAFVSTGLIYIAAFAVAGIFSSRIASTNSEVLLSSTSACGFWQYPYYALFDANRETLHGYTIQRREFFSNADQLIKKSHAYMAQCHGMAATQDEANEFCLPYGRSRISWSTDTHAACPFDDDMCLTEAIQFDSGFLNSYTHFGVNERHDRVEYRRIMTCAPITTEGHVSGYVDTLNYTEGYGTAPFEDETFLKYSYGQSVLFNDNTTFAYSNLSWGVSVGYFFPFKIYELDVEFSPALGHADNPEALSQASFVALPSLSRSNSDTTLIFLTLNATYLNEVRDPWFSATESAPIQWPAPNGTLVDLDFYVRNKPVNVMACAEQHQMRNPITGATSRLGGQEIATYSQVSQLGFNENQLATFNRSFGFASWLVMDQVVSALGGSYLLAAAYQDETLSTSIPDIQWQLELDHYFGVALNSLQLWSQQYVSGPFRRENDQYIVLPKEGFEEKMCHSQIARRADYRSFNVLGLAIILTFGLLAIILNMSIQSIVESFQGHTVKGRHRNAEWQANDFLQLQRMAYQHNNMGTWTGQRDLVPRTSAGELFTLPDSADWRHDGNTAPPPRDKRMSRVWSRGWSYRGNDAQAAAADSTSSDPGSNEKPADTASDVEKSFHYLVTHEKT